MRHLQITKERIFPIWKPLIIWKRFRGTLEFESRVNEKFEFNQCDEEVDIFTRRRHSTKRFCKSSQHLSNKKQSASKFPLKRENKGSEGRTGGCLVTVTESKETNWSEESCDVLLRQPELLDAQNDIETTTLKARILEASIDNETVQAQGEKVFTASLLKTELKRNPSWIDRMRWYLSSRVGSQLVKQNTYLVQHQLNP